MSLYNPVAFGTLYRLLQCICFSCHHLRPSPLVLKRYERLLRLIHAEKLEAAQKIMALEEQEKPIEVFGEDQLDEEAIFDRAMKGAKSASPLLTRLLTPRSLPSPPSPRLSSSPPLSLLPQRYSLHPHSFTLRLTPSQRTPICA